MNLIPQMASITEFVCNQRAVVGLLCKGPVRLAQDSQAVAVLVSLEDWATTVKRLAYLERVIAGDQASARNDFVTGDELAEEFAKMGVN